MNTIIQAAVTWGIVVPFAISFGWFAGIATANWANRTDRRRLRQLTKYCEHVDRELARRRTPDVPPIALVRHLPPARRSTL